MTETKRLITALSGHRGNRCYEYLCYAVYIACTFQPREPSMQTICLKVSEITESSPQAVSKALSRAAADIWDNGKRDVLDKICGHTFLEKPSPKDLIYILSQYLWIGKESSLG